METLLRMTDKLQSKCKKPGRNVKAGFLVNKTMLPGTGRGIAGS